jgi:hypothetical protein
VTTRRQMKVFNEDEEWKWLNERLDSLFWLLYISKTGPKGHSVMGWWTLILLYIQYPHKVWKHGECFSRF